MLIRINFDGACDNGMRKRLGKDPDMGIGVAVFINNSFEPVLSKFVGVRGSEDSSSNVAEWMGCVEAMKLAAEYKEAGDIIEIVSDSELITRQFNGDYEIKNHYFKQFYQSAMMYYRKIGQERLRIKHVRRNFNKEADLLSKKGLQLMKEQCSTSLQSTGLL